MKNDAFDLPESLYEFAQIPDFPKTIESLSKLAEEEDWTYQHSPDTDRTGYPILANYIRNTYRRLATEKKIAFSKDGKFSCFDTGLISRSQGEPIYMMFEENVNLSVPCYWHFKKFFRCGEHDVSKFSKLPDMAFYCDDPSKLIYMISARNLLSI